MSAKIYLKILAAILFVAISTLIAFSMDAAFWINGHLPSPQSPTNSLKTIRIASFDSSKTAPISLGEIKSSDNAYIKLKLRFRAESTESNPNLFQTAPVNRGMRLEISGSTAAIVIPDSGVPGGLRGLTLTSELKAGQWYELEVEALNHTFVHATLDKHSVANYSAPTLSMETSQILVGGGFDTSRTFHGQIENISVTTGGLSYSSYSDLTTESLSTIHAAPYAYGLTSESAKTIHVAKFDSRSSQPIAMGNIPNSNNAYVHIKLRFRVESTDGNPNLFQTAPANLGMRMEISGATAAILVPDINVPGGLKGITLSTALKKGQWYELEVEALNHAFVRANLDGLSVANYVAPGLSIETSKILVGGGFDSSRHFRGQIENIIVTKGSYNAPISFEGVKNPDNAYVRLKFRFRADSTESNPNLFQTDLGNSGLRLEISGSTATFLVSDSAEPTGIRGITLTRSLKTGQWYELEVEVLNGAFVRALLDAHPVFNYASASLSIASTQLLVGGGLDSSRNFRGQIEDITVVKGNLPRLPHQHLLIVYIMLAALIALFFFVLWKALGEYSAAQKMVGKLILLVTPLILILGYYEYRLSSINTIYYAKRVALERQLDKIEVLVTGSSNGLYGVAPETFSHKGFNLAFPANPTFSDAKLVEKYWPKMPKLRMVILAVNHHTMGSSEKDADQSWRQFFLRQYFDIATTEHLVNWAFWLNPHNFSKIALYGTDIKAQINTDFLTPVDIITSSSGWFDSGDVGNPLPIFGVNAANGHNSANDIRNYDRNLGYLETLIPHLQQNNISVVIVLTPTDISYYPYLDKSRVELLNQKLTGFANRHHVKFIDYTHDTRFSSNDYTWEMPDHINARGAMKLGKILDEEVIKPQW